MKPSVRKFKRTYMGKTIFHKQLWALNWLQPLRKGDVGINTDGSMKKGLSALCLVTIRKAKGLLMVRRGRREETKSICMPEYGACASSVVWLVQILHLGRINYTSKRSEKGSRAMSVHLTCCMDQLIDFLPVYCDFPPHYRFKARRRCSSFETGLAIQLFIQHRCAWDSPPLFQRY